MLAVVLLAKWRWLGALTRRGGQVQAKPVTGTDKDNLQGFVRDAVRGGEKVFTDDHISYKGLSGFSHDTVRHNFGEYVRNQIHTNGIESFWALLKRRVLWGLSLDV